MMSQLFFCLGAMNGALLVPEVRKRLVAMCRGGEFNLDYITLLRNELNAIIVEGQK